MKSKNQITKRKSIPTFKRKPVVIGIVGILFIFNWVLFSDEVYLIKDPVPTVTEDKVVYLEEVRKIEEDLGNDEYLFVPKSIAADESNVFVYDSSQKKVFRFSSDLKLIGSFGREGQGPGEFIGKWVELSIGQDGNVYANDIFGFKIMGYTREGKLLKTFRYGNHSHYYKPVSDKHGNIVYPEMKNGTIKVKTDKGILLTQCKSQRLHNSYLYIKPTDFFREMNRLVPFIPLASWQLTSDSKFLIYFQTSSALTIFDNNKYIKTIKLWPKKALQEYKKDYEFQRAAEKKSKFSDRVMGSFTPMFGYIIIDHDNPNIFYLPYGSGYSPKEIGGKLYAFNLEGKLLKVIHIPPATENEDSYGKHVRVQIKINNTFYAIRGEEVVLYKEK